MRMGTASIKTNPSIKTNSKTINTISPLSSDVISVGKEDKMVKSNSIHYRKFHHSYCLFALKSGIKSIIYPENFPNELIKYILLFISMNFNYKFDKKTIKQLINTEVK